MTQLILHSITPEELYSAIRMVVSEEVAKRFDKPVGRKEIAELFDCSLPTVDKIVQREGLKRLNPGGGHPKYSLNDVMGCKEYVKRFKKSM